MDVIRAFQFELPKVTDRMRSLIKQRQSDETKTPKFVSAHIPPAVFFSLTKELGATVVTNDVSVVCYFDPSDPEVEQIAEKIFVPTKSELESDGKTHEFYNHTIRSRWYDQYFDLDRYSRDELSNKLVPWAARQYVLLEEGVSLSYNMKTWKMSIMCTWKGVHKRPNRENAWVNGTVRRKSSLNGVSKIKRDPIIEPKEEADEEFQFFNYES